MLYVLALRFDAVLEVLTLGLQLYEYPVDAGVPPEAFIVMAPVDPLLHKTLVGINGVNIADGSVITKLVVTAH
jgi:hypothetical protein